MKKKVIYTLILIIMLIFNLTIFSYAENSKKLEITMEYKFNKENNTVTAYMHSNNRLASTKPTWNLSADKYTYSKTFSSNQTYTTPVQDIYGNIKDIEIKINQVLFPKITFEYEYNSNGTITGKIKSNIELKDTKPTWILSADKKIYTKMFYSEQTYTTPVQDIYGNIVNVNIEIKKEAL